jgi:succinyl-diaminopimelate desuccinylase
MSKNNAHRLVSQIKNSVRELREEIVAFTQDLIGIPTENPPGSHYRACIELISKKLGRLGLDPAIIEVRNEVNRIHPRSCVLASYGTGTKKLYFHGHYDVVPGSAPEQFKPQVRGGKLFGRGAADMKAGLAVMVYAVRVLQLLRFDPDGQICLVIVPDEETGGALGTRYLFEKGHIDKDNGVGMLMPEPTSGAVWSACRGALSLLITIKGRPVHAVLQNKGINAFEHMVALSNALLKLKKKVEKRTTGYAVGSGESRNSILMLGGVSRCGTNFNVVPGTCTFSIERRTNPEEDFAREKKQLMELLDRFRQKGMKIKIDILQEGESSNASSEHDLAKSIEESIRNIVGQRPRFSLCPGLLETRYYVRNGIPAYAYGPGLLARAHHPEEFVYVERILDCTVVYALTALRMLSAKERP